MENHSINHPDFYTTGVGKIEDLPALPQVRILRPRKELCWNEQWFGNSLRTVKIVKDAIHLTEEHNEQFMANRIIRIKEIRWMNCAECGSKEKWRYGKLRCNPCSREHQRKTARERKQKQRDDAKRKQYGNRKRV